MLLRQLAAWLGVPTTASQGDLRPLIEGKLTEVGRDPLHTQVLLREVEHGTHMSLQDETGVFSEFEPPEPLPSDASEGEDDEDLGTEPEVVTALRTDQLRKELEAQRV